jgi:dephospho-CoA kinase
MILVGLTGGIGSGKTTVARLLAQRGAIVVDADELAREALRPGTRGFEQVWALFGDEVVTPDGELDRSSIAAIVFTDEEKRRALESITHPEVFRLLAEAVEWHRNTDNVVVFDAPLIIETGFHEACDVVVVVTASEERRIERLQRDRGMTPAEASVRIAAQIGADEREAVADVVIENDGDLSTLEHQIDVLWASLAARVKP